MNNCKTESAAGYTINIRVSCVQEERVIVTNLTFQSLSEKLIDICNRANGTNPVITFNKYYTYGEDNECPCIIRNGEFEWHVPLEDVTIAEFLHTHDIQLSDGIDIESGYPMAGGPGLIGAIEIWEKIWPIICQYAPHIITTVGFLSSSINLMTWIKKHLKKKKLTPYPHIFFEAIYKRSMWNHNELADLLGCSYDDAKDWLKALGYKWDNSKKFYVVTDMDRDNFVEMVRKVEYHDI